MKYALWLLLCFILMQFIVQVPWLAGPGGMTTAFERTFGSGGGVGIRLYLWKESWLIFTKYPLLGAGFGQYGWQHFQLGAVLHDLRINGLYDNAHNLVMQLAAETGLAGLTILFSTLGLWLWQAWDEPRTIYHWWGYVVLAVLGIHSLLEYPLWYLYFIGIAAVVLGMTESKVYRLKLDNPWLLNLGRLSVVALILFLTFLLMQQYQGYKKLESTLAMRLSNNGDDNAKARLRSDLVDIFNNYALTRPYSELFLAGMIVPDTNHLADKLALNEEVMHLKPIDAVVYREIWLLALSDRLPEAKIQVQRTLWAYPGTFQAALDEMKRTAFSDPTHFTALSEFASQQYDEYQRAAHAK
jgi:hypothetical protein